MKCHTGVGAGNGFIHTVDVTVANVHDVTAAVELLREDDKVVYGDSAYLGLRKREGLQGNENFSMIEYRIDRRPGKLSRISDNSVSNSFVLLDFIPLIRAFLGIWN